MIAIRGNRFVDLTGRRFGMMTVIAYDPERSTDKGSAFLCICDCGNIKSLLASNLQRHASKKNCGCKINWNEATEYRIANPRLYAIWKGMKARCNNPNVKSYKTYGAKGIRLCDEWEKSFIPFCKWALTNEYADNLTIDREKSNKNYEPSNCRWLTRLENITRRWHG